MSCVQQLDERAPDYDQALGELAAAIQRMALLQALPDLRGEDEEQDIALAALAVRFSPEDLQLLYQIAIMARRDLDFAPDARGGFEMALLRMLAFRPAEASAAPAVPPPAAQRTVAKPLRDAGRAGGSSGPVASPGDWATIVSALGLQGPASQLAAHCLLAGRSRDVVRLRLDPAGESFHRPQIVERLAQALSQYFGQAIRLEISVGAIPDDEQTPARRQALDSDERLKAAEQAIDDDPAVRAMRDVFGATVQPGSVRPLN
jgi:DNA polymerase-3 subunit gamma/tau